MQYLELFFEYAAQYAVYAVIGAVSLITIFAVVNLVFDDYRKINKGLRNSITKLKRGCRNGWAEFYDSLPQPYRLLWKCYTATGGGVYIDRAVDFVAVRQRVLFKLGILLSWAVALVYGVAFFYSMGESALYISMSVLFYSVTVLLIVRFSHIAKLNRARRIYTQWTACVDGFFGKDYSFTLNKRVEDKDVSRTTNALSVQKDPSRVAEILRNSNLDGQRSVAQQRKLNVALNSLVCGANK